MRKSRFRLHRRAAAACAVAALLGAAPATRAADASAPAEDAPDISLEDLLQADVQTAGRKSQRLQDVAAAVYVITREEIERSGATTIPDALRLAPGMQVAHIANNRWAVTARGFNGRFANKLLVLMDGRSIYSPLFSGVLWEYQDTMLEDIERIEVIRGPGASMWGANAVNGVINIITRKARDTRGMLAVAGAGTEERGFAAVRQGWSLGEDANLRVWAKSFARDTSVLPDGSEGNDSWYGHRAGFRGDWQLDTTRRLTVSGAAYDDRTGDRWDLVDLAATDFTTLRDVQQNGHGAHLLGRHEWLWADGSEAAVQAYLEQATMDVVGSLQERRTTADVDVQWRPRLHQDHDVILGAGYRESRDDLNATLPVAMTPDSRTMRLASVFVQDEITLVPARWKAVLGARLEHNDATGFEPQPNARLVWTPDAQRTLWGAVSRAVRTPSRAERDSAIDLRVDVFPQVPLPVLTRSQPPEGHRLGSERLTAYELGYRHQFDPALSLDVAAFENHYDHLRAGATSGAPFMEMAPFPHLVQIVRTATNVSARTRGLETAVDWHVLPQWRLQFSHTLFSIRAEAEVDNPAAVATAESLSKSGPRSQWALRSSWGFGERSRIDAWLRHVGTVGGGDGVDKGVPAYTELDLRVATRPWPGVELSLVGQNLLRSAHPEAVADQLNSQALEVQRGVYAKLKWQY